MPKFWFSTVQALVCGVTKWFKWIKWLFRWFNWFNQKIIWFKWFNRVGGGLTSDLRASPLKELHSCAKVWEKNLESRVMDRFWRSSCLNNSINLPDMIGSLASGTNTSLVAKNGTIKKPLSFFLPQYMPHGNWSTAFVFQYIWKWLTVHGSMDPAQQLSYTKFLFPQLL